MDQDPESITPRAFDFGATRGSFARLLLSNALLTLVTLGIYRFWAKTRTRRYFWRNVSFLDDPLEYTGTGGELFVGFLIVVAVLFPLGLVYSAIGAVVPADHPELQAGLEVAYYVVLFALLQIGFYRMWRYRMSRTRWRGVRFGLDGSTWSYLKLSAGWSVVMALTLGGAYPWMQIDLWRYQIRHTRLGDQAFRFEGDARALFGAWAPVFLLGLSAAAASLFVMNEVGFDGAELVRALKSSEADHVLMQMAVITGFGIASALAYFFYAIRRTRFQISGIRLGQARFQSSLPFARLLGFAVLGIVLALAVLAAVAAVFATIAYTSNADFGLRLAAPWSVIAIILGLVLVFPFAWTLLFKFEVVKQTVSTTAVHNPHVLEQASQVADSGPRTGEGLADALDIGGF